MKSKRSSVLISIGCLLALPCLAGVQYAYDRSSHSLGEKLFAAVYHSGDPLVPQTPILHVLSFGRPEVAADLLWLKTIQYFGSVRPFSSYPSLGPLLDRVTQLDPKFEYPYEFGLIVLPYSGATQTAVMLGERAQTNLPNNGLLTYYLATVYHLNLNDYNKAGYYYEKAADEPGAPGAARQLAGVSFDKVNNTLADRLVALNFWKTVYDHAASQEEKDRAGNWYKNMEMVYTLERAAIAYQNQKGHYPASLQELKDQGYIPEIPVSPVGRAFILDPKTGKVSFDTLANP